MQRNTKEKICMEALHLFLVHGYEGVSVKAIAKAVGIKDSSLYNHFNSKRAVFDELQTQFEQTCEKMMTQFEMACSEDNHVGSISFQLINGRVSKSVNKLQKKEHIDFNCAKIKV